RPTRTWRPADVLPHVPVRSFNSCAVLHGRHQPSRNTGSGQNPERKDGCADHHTRGPTEQQFVLPHDITGCGCTEITIAVPVPSARASRARIRVVIFMLFSPQAVFQEAYCSAFFRAKFLTQPPDAPPSSGPVFVTSCAMIKG